MRRGVYPGSFDPPTTAHLAVVDAALSQRRLTRLDLVISRRPLGKSAPTHPSLDDRLAVLRESVAHLDGVGVLSVEARLLADIAAGYDVVVMGADKWHQIHELEFYDGSPRTRDEALASLPEVAVAPRPPFPVPPRLALDLDPEHHATSSTRAREGDLDLMTPAARAHAEATGAWTADARLRRNSRRGRGDPNTRWPG